MKTEGMRSLTEAAGQGCFVVPPCSYIVTLVHKRLNVACASAPHKHMPRVCGVETAAAVN